MTQGAIPLLRSALEGVRAEGRRAFVAYVTAGLDGVDSAFLRALAATGCDAIEIGIPFSDPVMDGPVIQEASRRALGRSTGAAEALRLVADAALGVPVAGMTYANVVMAGGQDGFLDAAAAAGLSGMIVPDLPVDEAGPWIAACRARRVAPVLLASPNASDDRLARIARESDGFVYCVSTLGVTGSRGDLAASAAALVGRLRPLAAAPLLVGVGISTPEQAAEAVGFADGVVVGSALVEPLLRGRTDEALARARAFREAIDAQV